LSRFCEISIQVPPTLDNCSNLYEYNLEKSFGILKEKSQRIVKFEAEQKKLEKKDIYLISETWV
jgi:hypothetical protein